MRSSGDEKAANQIPKTGGEGVCARYKIAHDHGAQETAEVAYGIDQADGSGAADSLRNSVGTDQKAGWKA